ncbi:hypothetical protein [Bradyrhizobium betae]|uniref:Uncharacterized protein n=1 Tax=Bradyrhizobium betae TaxID=244734 RepID=A0A4Q1V6T1_9BRAD|nr:hypothetical protein [Bradyrhizobium betae]RXT46640.1 hypothetical protein B5V03_17085 [Bradyrhizobium betae]
MEFRQIKLANYTAFGEKVKAWAKGNDPIPGDLEELREQLAAAEVGATIPDNITKVKFIQADDDTWIVRLPAKQYLEASEKRLEEADYTLPAFYERTFRSKPHVEDKMKFQAERIADYTINGCG